MPMFSSGEHGRLLMGSRGSQPPLLNCWDMAVMLVMLLWSQRSVWSELVVLVPAVSQCERDIW